MRGFLRRGARAVFEARGEILTGAWRKGRYSEFDENNPRLPNAIPPGRLTESGLHFSLTNRANMRCIWRINPALAKSRKSI